MCLAISRHLCYNTLSQATTNERKTMSSIEKCTRLAARLISLGVPFRTAIILSTEKYSLEFFASEIEGNL